jgi:hypothetical protein
MVFENDIHLICVRLPFFGKKQKEFFIKFCVIFNFQMLCQCVENRMVCFQLDSWTNIMEIWNGVKFFSPNVKSTGPRVKRRLPSRTRSTPSSMTSSDSTTLSCERFAYGRRSLASGLSTTCNTLVFLSYIKTLPMEEKKSMESFHTSIDFFSKYNQTNR